MIYIVLIIFSISALLALAVILIDANKGKYTIKEKNGIELKSILSAEAEEKYLKEFSENNIKDLKIQIEKVADMLISGDESNRYTENLRKRAQKDEQIIALKNAVVEKVELIKYTGDDLKARINYKDYNNKYSMILSMNTVVKGRVFLNNYFIFLGTGSKV